VNRRALRSLGIVGPVALLVAGLGVWTATRPPTPPTGWARLGTEDVHSLAFAPDSTEHLYFGHHGGILESRDGGRSWSPLPVSADAMGMRPAADGSIVIAGHEVLIASADGGRTWAPLRSDLPNIDIHAFARDPGEPRRMWAYLAEGGVYESPDGGTHWSRVLDGHRPFLTAIRSRTGSGLLGIDPFEGLVRSDDGGRTWASLSQPEAFPVFALAATPDGRIVLIGTGDELLRSSDGGRNWESIGFPSSPFAIAVSADGRSIALVSRSTEFYRSDDGGRTWPGP
jgi:photosystem II stability/assembly factor-like uncharacterized protein